MKKENNIEVTRTVRFKLIGTYDIGDGFCVDIVFDRETQMYDYWLYSGDGGAKVKYLQVPKSNIVKPEDVGIYFNNMEFWEEDKQHYTDNYMV